MKSATLYFSAALCLGLSASPVSAQNSGAAFAIAPLTLDQGELISRLRTENREAYMRARRRMYDTGFRRHISQWTQADFLKFRRAYRTDGRDNLKRDALLTTIFFEEFSQQTAAAKAKAKD